MAITRLRITFDMFSGRPDPVVELAGPEAEELLARLAPGDQIDAAEQTTPGPHLGYRGLIVERAGEQVPFLPEVFRLVAGRLLGPELRRWAADPEVEDYICSERGPAGQVLSSPAELDFLRDGLAAARTVEWWRPPPDGQDSLAVAACPSAPAAALDKWNDAEARSIIPQRGIPNWSRQCNNNCYNYGTDVRTDTFAQPGRGSGRGFTVSSLACDLISRYAFYDGLVYTPAANNVCPLEGILVALVMAPGVDYHWYRLGSDGFWAHKIGETPATDLDNGGQKITDPRTCSRGSYSVFCSFMNVPDGSARIS
ncbi:hypothetical protein [Streptomyces xantholiticus]|uniref:hypothetical protein n=1 Tax=Streptomyces xantholiticus TaxID=68285 RepID=UPI001673F686|nr:hypothetical protein [Streptomyces xantholiticus]GGW47575.1 hypothetical protein GCM10010381_36070 [Streptomyces xantholiticus]